MLARAQTWDARHNDLQWTWAKQTLGDYVATRILGRRQFMNANANRVCAWTRLTDRDGDVHVYGLNYHGRVLVDAVHVGPEWKFAETLYNADGNVISQRTLSQSQNWTATSGDTRYSYMDLVGTGASLVAPLPSYWARRGNVVRIIQRPRGGTVEDEIEGAPGTTQTSRGRFAFYEYEPFYNQVRREVSGSIDARRRYVPTLTTTALFDYQERPLTGLTPVLQHLQAFGYGFPVDSKGNLLYADIETRLAISFNLGDVNGDGVLGATLTGLPVQVENKTPSGQREFSLYRWNPSARPYFVQRPDFSVDSMLYLKAGSFSGPGSLFGGGQVASIQHVPRKAWPDQEGPSTPSCPTCPARLACSALAGPYQWLLPWPCSGATLQADLEAQLKLPVEAAQAIVRQQQATIDATTVFTYFVTGQTQTITRPDGSHVEDSRDLDGRVREEKLFNAGNLLHSRSATLYDALMRPTQTQRFDRKSNDLGKQVQAWDEEGHLLYDCAEFVSGGCVRANHGGLPLKGQSTTFWYSPEGMLQKTQDAEGATSENFRDARKWVRRVATSAVGETTRGPLYEYDDDGQVLTALHGSEFTGLLSELRGYDPLGRLIRVRDAEGRRFTVANSRRDVTTRVDVLNSAFPRPVEGLPPLWRTVWGYDDFGRVRREFTNGTLTREVLRRAGGQAWACPSSKKTRPAK